MERELRIGQHLVFLDEHRRERDSLVLAIHGDPQGRLSCSVRKSASELTEEERASGRWQLDGNDPPIYAYKQDENGHMTVEYKEPGEHWPCLNLVVVDDNEGAQDQYGRQTKKEGVTSIVHWTNSSAHGFCWRWPDEVMTGKAAPTIS